MHILMFSYDTGLVERTGVGDVLLRHQHYAEHLDRLDIIVPAPVAKRQAEIKVSEKLVIYPSYGHKLLSWLRSYLKARRICSKSKVDIVVTQDALLGFLGVLLRKEFGCKLQVNAFGPEVLSEWWLRQRWLHRFYHRIMCWVLRRADLIRTDATQSKVLLSERLNIPPEKVVVIPALPSAESIAKFVKARGEMVRKSLLGSEYERMVLFVGALEKIKNIPNLLRAARLVLSTHPRTLFIIIGSGPEKERLEEMCRELTIAGKVRFLGIIPYDDLPAYYAACDLVVLPSWSEGFARTLMEAAFARKPIVATDVGGARDIVVDGETGYIVAVDDSAQLAEKIEELLSNPKRAKEMGEAGYQKATAYCDFAANTKKLVETWRALAEASEGRR
jgi:phosphatidylinositol alpha-1,6-mannosyltransferase